MPQSCGATVPRTTVRGTSSLLRLSGRARSTAQTRSLEERIHRPLALPCGSPVLDYGPFQDLVAEVVGSARARDQDTAGPHGALRPPVLAELVAGYPVHAPRHLSLARRGEPRRCEVELIVIDGTI